MIVAFEKDYLRELYETGKSEYKRGVDYLKQARNIEELFLLPSLHYEVLKGDKAGVSSIRVNDQYRIEFTVEQVSEPIVVTICSIIELSNHYK